MHTLWLQNMLCAKGLTYVRSLIIDDRQFLLSKCLLEVRRSNDSLSPRPTTPLPCEQTCVMFAAVKHEKASIKDDEYVDVKHHNAYGKLRERTNSWNLYSVSHTCGTRRLHIVDRHLQLTMICAWRTFSFGKIYILRSSTSQDANKLSYCDGFQLNISHVLYALLICKISAI